MQVAVNGCFFISELNEQIMRFLHNKIKHVIYIVKENRTYDQVLGDLGTGNGDLDLAFLGGSLTLNQH